MFRCVLWVLRTTLLVLSSPHPSHLQGNNHRTAIMIKNTHIHVCTLIGISWGFPPHTVTLVPQNHLVKCCVHVLAMYAMSMNHSQTYMIGFVPPPSPDPRPPESPWWCSRWALSGGDWETQYVSGGAGYPQCSHVHTSRLKCTCKHYLPMSVHGRTRLLDLIHAVLYCVIESYSLMRV